MTTESAVRDPRLRPSRRAVLAGFGGIAAGFAGCAGTTNDNPDDPLVVASFFTFFDFAKKIANGTSVQVKNLVPTGMHGHGWEPDPSITRDIIDADVFLHVGPDFQPWADRTIQTVIDDGADTQRVNVREGIDLIDLASTVEDDEQVDDGKDPHFWLDPTLAKLSVDNITDAFTEISPDEGETFETNADGVKDNLDQIDTEWQDIFDDSARDTVFLAAHNAFEYIARRYDTVIHPLVKNLAADGDVRPVDMQRAQDTIEEHDIQYIGAAVFEPRRPAQVLRDETNVEAYYPVTPYAGTTPEWVERDWGYFEIARQINMETFRIILGVADPSPEFDDEWRNFE